MRRIKKIALASIVLGGIVAAAGADSGMGALGAARIPFIANEGQVSDPAVKYYARTFGGAVYALADGSIVYSLPKRSGAHGGQVPAGSAILRERFNNAAGCGEIAGAGRSPVIVSSFVGNRPEKWRSALPVFERLDFGEIYDGISLVLRAGGNNVEKVFVLSPGADPGDISFGYEGARGMGLGAGGELEIETALGPVSFSRPVAWQVDARGREEDVQVAYVLRADNSVGFELGPYDRDNILVIDPLLASTFIGGGGSDAVQSMAVESGSNIYVAGYTDSADFPVQNSYCATNSGCYDAFVSRFDVSLGALLASTYLGGSSDDVAKAVGVDAAGRVWLAGYTESDDLPTTVVSMDQTYNGNGDAFMAILQNNLSDLYRITYMGGSELDSATAIALDNGGQPKQYVAGYTESADFPVTNSVAFGTNYSGARDVFVASFNNNLTRAAYLAGVFVGGTNADQAFSAVLSPGVYPTNFLFVAGYTTSADFPVKNGWQMTQGGAGDGFIFGMHNSLNAITSATYLGGSLDDCVAAAAIDVSNRIYVTGYTFSLDFPRNPTNNAYLPGWNNTYRGAGDAFLSALSNNLSRLFASTYVGGTGEDAGTCVAIDSNTVFVAGYTASTNFPASPAAYDRTPNGGVDAFLFRFDARLTNMYASTYLGGAGDDRAAAVVLADSTNMVFAAGVTESGDFPACDTSYQTFFAGNSDGFVSKFPVALSYGTLKWRKTAPAAYCGSPVLNWDGSIALGANVGLASYTRDGALKWSVNVTSEVPTQSPTDYAGLGVPAVGTNGSYYFNKKNGFAHRMLSTGVNVWTFKLTGVDDFWGSPAIEGSGRIYAGKARNLHAIGPDGAGLWTNSLPDLSFSSPAIGTDNTVYASTYVNSKLYAYSRDGVNSRMWTMGELGGFMYSSPAIGDDGTVYAAFSNKLFAFNPAGGTNWVSTLGAGNHSWSSPAISTGGVVYVGGPQNLYSFNPGGSAGPVWTIPGEYASVKCSPAILADGSIIVGSTNGIVYSFNPDGTTNWACDTFEQIHFQSPVIDSDGTIYICNDSAVCAIYGSAPLASGGWPMFRHDSLRTGNKGFDAASILRPNAPVVSKGYFTNRVAVGWSPVPNAVSYEVWRSLTNSIPTASLIRKLTQTNFNDSTVEPGKIYYYWLKAKTPVALSDFSASDSGGIPPLPPGGVQASDGVPTNGVRVTWQPSSNAATYYVYRAMSADTNAAEWVGSTATTNFIDYTVAPGLRHYFWVKAGNAEAGVSGFSAYDSGGIPSWPVSGFSASQGAYYNAVVLNWTAPTGAASYVVFRNTESNSAAAAIYRLAAGSPMEDSAVTPMRRYYYWVKATNEYGLSPISPCAEGWGLLRPPVRVTASSGTFSNMIRVSWQAGSTDATAHVVFRSATPDFGSAEAQTEVVYGPDKLTETNYDDTAITRGATYYYWASAKNLYGSSAVVQADSPGGTIPGAPTDLFASDGTFSNMVYVTWAPAVGALYYTVFRGLSADFSAAEPLESSLSNSFEDRGALMGVLYYYWVKAANAYGLSALGSFNSGWRGMMPPDSISASDGVSTNDVSVTWSLASGATTYELWRGVESNAATASRLANNIADLSYLDRSASPGRIYYYWVKAKNGSYVSSFSQPDYGYRAIGQVDLGVSDLVFVPSAMGLLTHPYAVSFKVTNRNGPDMIEPNNTLQYDFYLSRYPEFGAGETYWFGGTNASLTLPAGATASVVIGAEGRNVISVPIWATDSYYVYVFVNHCLPSSWQDPNLANNSTRRAGGPLAVTSAGAVQPLWNDFDGDGKTDLAVFNAASGAWRVWLSAGAYAPADFANPAGVGGWPVSRDYDGDGKADPAVYSESSGAWSVNLSGSAYASAVVYNWGGPGWKPAPADYDGDGKTDPAVYSEATGTWRVWMSSLSYTAANGSGMGGPGWKPVTADYDGDGKADPAVYAEAAGAWRVWLSGASYIEATAGGWGGPGYKPVPADYDGDGKVDPGVYGESSGAWRVWVSGAAYRENGASGWGGAGQTAVPGDYDGDGRSDACVFWETMGLWRFWVSTYSYAEADMLASAGVGFHAVTAGE